jgi:predicted small lipoprotein YifL
MKRLILIISALALVFVLAACGTDTPEAPPVVIDPTPEVTAPVVTPEPEVTPELDNTEPVRTGIDEWGRERAIITFGEMDWFVHEGGQGGWVENGNIGLMSMHPIGPDLFPELLDIDWNEMPDDETMETIVLSYFTPEEILQIIGEDGHRIRTSATNNVMFQIRAN